MIINKNIIHLMNKKFYIILFASYHSLKRFYLEDFTYQVSALAFISLLSLIPIVSVFLYLFSFFAFFHGFINYIKNYIYLNFMPNISSTATIYIEEFAYQANQLPFISFIFSFFTGITLMFTIERVLNSIWKNENKKNKNLVSRFGSWLILFGILLFTTMLTFISISISSLFLVDKIFSIFSHLIQFICNIILLTAVFVYIPVKTISWHDGMIAGTIATIFFELGKRIFEYYIIYITNYQYIYGTLAIIPIFIIWIYLSWMIILLSAIYINEKNKLSHK